MKRYGNLIPAITDLNNLYWAYWKASRGKTHKPEVQIFQANLTKHLHKLQHEIIAGQLDIGHYHYFTIYDPKERMICAASFPERVLHHALMNVCHPYFERWQIADSYATRINKGTYKALGRAFYFHYHHQFYLKLDIRKYFDSIAHGILMQQLNRRFKDKHLLGVFQQILSTYEILPGKGLPIGNLTSQYFANHYLSGFDHWVKEQLRVKAYVRYMDDMVLWADDKEQLKHWAQQIRNYLTETLHLQLKTCTQNTTHYGVNFLSYRLRNRHIAITGKSKKRFLTKYKAYCQYLERGQWTQKEFQRHVEPLLAFTFHASSKGFRKKVFEEKRQ